MHRACVLLPLVLLSCGKKPSDTSAAASARKGEVALSVSWPRSLRCALWTRETSPLGFTMADPAGCNVTVRFGLNPSGAQDVDLPTHRGAAAGVVTRTSAGEGVRNRTVIHRDPGSEGQWQVAFPEDILPTCPGSASDSRNTLDLSPWRFLVVRVVSMDSFGNLRPIAEQQEDTLALRVAPQGAEVFRPTLIASNTHDGVWGAVWCANQTPGDAEVTLDVRGAYQLETDAFPLPASKGELNARLEYIVTPR